MKFMRSEGCHCDPENYRNCRSCGVEFLRVDYRTGQDYSHCERCRKYNPDLDKSFDHTGYLGWRVLFKVENPNKNPNEMWSNIWPTLLKLTNGRSLFEIKTFRSGKKAWNYFYENDSEYLRPFDTVMARFYHKGRVHYFVASTYY